MVSRQNPSNVFPYRTNLSGWCIKELGFNTVVRQVHNWQLNIIRKTYQQYDISSYLLYCRSYFALNVSSKMTFTGNCDKPSLLQNINSIYTQKSNLSHILGVRRQIAEIFGVCCNEHPVKAPSSLLKKSRLRDLNHVGKRKRKKPQTNDSSCERGVWHQTSLPFVWLDVKRGGDECASKYAQSYLHNLDISCTTDGAIKLEAQLPWEYDAF